MTNNPEWICYHCRGFTPNVFNTDSKQMECFLCKSSVLHVEDFKQQHEDLHSFYKQAAQKHNIHVGEDVLINKV